MKNLLYLLLALFALPLLTSPAFANAEERDARKDAAAWVKTAQDTHKKALGILKKVKNKKSADAAAKKLSALFPAEGKKTAMGATGPARMPDSEVLEEVAGSRLEKIREMGDEIQAEVDRIEGLDLGSSALNDAIDAMEAGLQTP